MPEEPNFRPYRETTLGFIPLAIACICACVCVLGYDDFVVDDMTRVSDTSSFKCDEQFLLAV